ncbi:hypothetical protein F5148DRAFT_1284190 [Russula earlei]|uniref:Uncharacterized protein n=1 Tax=Russula earlei TaxID=71964 RepID=A0ACC0UAI3_9AGAM|nr:hypothetical protein F5148DRAFT_1284190 [Russula earlei]
MTATSSKIHSLASPSSTPSRPHNSRNIILCFDGTGNEFCDKNTNIVRLFSILRVDCPKLQAGIGTYFKPSAVSPIFRGVAQLLDQGFAWYLSEHIIDGYTFLMQNYHEGDSICIFGFSRGAYTARVLAGMLHKYKLFKSRTRESDHMAGQFKNTFGRKVVIDFLGVWDTVASVGWLRSPELPFVGSNDTIRVFRHALSLDEPLLKRIVNFLNPFKVRYLKQTLDTSHVSVEDPGFTTHVREVWFAGSHSDVGGGNAKDSDKYALSNLSLRWMVREIVGAREFIPKFEVLFDPTALSQWNIPQREIRPSKVRELSDATVVEDVAPPTVIDEGHHSPSEKKAHARTGLSDGESEAHALAVEESFDVNDALSKSLDEIENGRLWWLWRIIEIFPSYYKWQDKHGRWVGQWRCVFVFPLQVTAVTVVAVRIGRPHLRARRILPPNPELHRSVLTRIEKYDGYKVKAKYEDTAKWVE